MAEFCWGVDVAVSHLAFAFADLETQNIHAESLNLKTPAREGERLAHILSTVRRYAFKTRPSYPPAAIFVEQASGRFRSPQLVYVVGVVQAALFEASGVPVWTLPSSTWKKRTVGNGNATKPQAAAWLENQGVIVEGQDQVDASCLALAGRGMLTTGLWEAV